VAQVKGFDPPSCHSACPLLVVASSYTITTLAPSALGDVGTGVSRFMVVDDVFKDRGRLVLLGVLGMNRGLSPVGRAPQAACCMAAVSRSPRISSWARRALGFDGSGMLRRSMAAASMFWLAQPKTGARLPCPR
jgi:hypothetical protein